MHVFARVIVYLSLCVYNTIYIYIRKYTRKYIFYRHNISQDRPTNFSPYKFQNECSIENNVFFFFFLQVLTPEIRCGHCSKPKNENLQSSGASVDVASTRKKKINSTNNNRPLVVFLENRFVCLRLSRGQDTIYIHYCNNTTRIHRIHLISSVAKRHKRQ